MAKDRREINPERQKELNRNYKLRHPEKLKESQKRSHWKNREKRLSLYRAWRVKHKEDETLKTRARISRKKYEKNHIQELRKRGREDNMRLPDYRIVVHLKRTYSEITPELIEVTRQRIIMKRTLKQLKEWRKEHESDRDVISGKQRKDETVNEVYRGREETGYGGDSGLPAGM
jgi:hypothetical protein